MEIKNKYLRYALLTLFSGWTICLHQIFVLALFLTISLTIKPSLYLEIFKKKNYQELKIYSKEGKQQRRERKILRIEKKKMKKERIKRFGKKL